ncbi:hypothetical protein [Pseudanabaena sp. FACHB-2040]|uniref:hypothetical protein n=1 Tax=Pseudanabaena sp. FACHB-2040 TaxID=2692859 RepID=UPI001684F5A6|nr:hypothetical protein [Pseudanabaena sp. FACHB-2040]MBD2258321.1 hypothetical protein [Pseudanabaena sp. FACHB-2040]
MAPPKVATSKTAAKPEETTPPAPEAASPELEIAAPESPPQESPSQDANPANIEDIFAALKSLLGTVEKLQKARQEVGDIKPLLVRMLDGELLSGDELDQLKSGVNGLSRLVRSYDDYQSALAKAQPARELLDLVLKS